MNKTEKLLVKLKQREDTINQMKDKNSDIVADPNGVQRIIWRTTLKNLYSKPPENPKEEDTFTDTLPKHTLPKLNQEGIINLDMSTMSNEIKVLMVSH